MPTLEVWESRLEYVKNTPGCVCILHCENVPCMLEIHAGGCNCRVHLDIVNPDRRCNECKNIACSHYCHKMVE